MAIKYTPKFNKEIRRILKNYNAKVTRLEEKFPTSRRIPPHISASGLKNNYENRGDLITKLKQLESFNQSKMSETVSITSQNIKTNKYEYESFLLNKSVARKRIQHLYDLNRERDRSDGRFLPSHRTRALKAQLRTLDRASSSNFGYQAYLAARNLASRYTDRREESDKQFYENFFDMLWANQQYAELDEDMVEKAHDMFESLSPEQLLEMYNREPDVHRLVEDYNLYSDTQGYSLTDEEVIRARIRFESLFDELPELIKKYSKF